MFLRGLLSVVLSVHTDAIAAGTCRLPQLSKLAAQVETAGWVSWKWSAENPLIHKDNSMFPVGCPAYY